MARLIILIRAGCIEMCLGLKTRFFKVLSRNPKVLFWSRVSLSPVRIETFKRCEQISKCGSYDYDN